ncbi:hypothetical protein SAMN05421810_106249 [Amycolatopsis arida]|uniref:SseB protein N-terminal domain-containing protein n=1 Tax=Amycolatopsis arida TaxID=587909 RepID=A0A1I5XTP3_9PSEU|nr:SAV_915 family protein [Amycolatopsis arida]TDX97270.1 hypothetical protein CLV69_102373 [Amycolatopsis arida]SFQ35351.1 hypothetical protein SAMN05421810_106249 [Amycolatopsis arida]
MEDRPVIPPMVYLACDSVDGDDFIVHVRATKDDERAVFVYSAYDRLLNCCGPHQRWVVLPTRNLERVAEHVHFDMILIDIEMPEELRRKAA